MFNHHNWLNFILIAAILLLQLIEKELFRVKNVWFFHFNNICLLFFLRSNFINNNLSLFSYHLLLDWIVLLFPRYWQRPLCGIRRNPWRAAGRRNSLYNENVQLNKQLWRRFYLYISDINLLFNCAINSNIKNYD
jgi:hypothetical protein